MSYHVFRDIDRDKLLSIMDSNRVPNEIWGDHGSPRPGLDYLTLPRLIESKDFLEKLRMHVRPLL
jgi:hypothetical protein